MKVFREWGTDLFREWGSTDHISIVDTIQEEYMPGYYGEGAVLVNQHYVYKKEDRHLIKEITPNQEKRVRTYLKKIKEYRRLVEQQTKLLNAYLKRVYQ